MEYSRNWVLEDVQTLAALRVLKIASSFTLTISRLLIGRELWYGRWEYRPWKWRDGEVITCAIVGEKNLIKNGEQFSMIETLIGHRWRENIRN